MAKNPSHQSPYEHLLYARALAANGQRGAAIEEYEVLRESFTGEEARVRFALLLKEMEQSEKSLELFVESLLRAKRAPRHYRQREKHWMALADKG